MYRVIVSMISILYIIVGLTFAAYASEHETLQSETSMELESGDQVTVEGLTESLVEDEKIIQTETEENEDANMSAIIVDKTESIENETETVEKSITETELSTETEIPTETETEIETIFEIENTDETETITETERLDEVEIITETEGLDNTESVADTEAVNETQVETVDETETIAETETETTDETEIKTEKIYSIEFPDIEELRFVLDPYGLRGLTERKSASLEELKPYAGKVYCNQKVMVTNKSSVPIKVKVSVQLTGDIRAVESVEELESDTGNNVFLYIVPSENDLKGNLDNYQKSDIGIVVKKDEPTVIEFILPNSNYVCKQSAEGDSMTYEIADNEEGHSTAFEIAGLINTRANWKKFDIDGKKIGLRVNYTYEDASEQLVESRLYKTFAMLPYDGATVEIKGE